MTQDVKHSPLPWHYEKAPQMVDGAYDYGISADSAKILAETFGRDTDGKFVDAVANAQFIVTSCNSHYELVEALEDVVKRSVFAPAVGGLTVFHTFEQIKRLRDALAKVKP